MGPKEFASIFLAEKNSLMETYFVKSEETMVSNLIEKANLNDDQRAMVMSAMDAALTDTLYTILLSLDGSASLGDIQQSYKITAEDGSIVSNGDGALEIAAWEVFQAD